MSNHPHQTQSIATAGQPLAQAAGVLILLHGRGASARDILGLGAAIATPGLALLAPQAAGATWYPCSFLAPRAQNEPFLSSALAQVATAVDLAIESGIPVERIALAGFSQGGCLASEFVGRAPRRYAALIAFTGGLIGPLDEAITLTGDLAGTPVLLSSGDPDPHVPWQRVQQTADQLTAIGAAVQMARYPGRPHTVLPQEVEQAQRLLQTTFTHP